MIKPLLLLTASLPLHAEITAVAHPEQAFPHDKTAVWTPLFQASWDRLNELYGGPPTKVVPPNPLIAQLDAFKWKPATVMPPDGWKTWAGPATQTFLDQVNPEAAKLLGKDQGPFLPPALEPGEREGATAFYGVLAKSIEFSKPFHRSVKVPLVFRAADGGKPVHFFGTRDDESGEFAESVRVLAWRPVDKSHAIQVRTRSGEDTLVLYLPSKPQDFATACRWLRTWRGQSKPDAEKSGLWDDPCLHAHDEVMVPYVKLESATDFADQLQSQRVYRNQPLPRLIKKAELKVRFELHEKGARVEATVEGMDPFAGGKMLHPRAFRYDRPFFVFLWRDGAAWPYFGAWIGDPSFLDPWK